ncbi:PREDICTED: B3 domain-containing protein Os01g0234100-like isoform X1 [Erythranthe guttata]|uniref:B3 domain-containing protein Os01g0234100-like isoform X1 n=1 Tax=Erythranthe guttata TaxID=4155 RepID=UPI00064DD68B|nr:PREDICTED: B3 domain-containing protein Os01g0234100-like isoform X1 [Erythranthe guttata]|eukprot:XP_012831052.1 PREDICTED: B3 domain-containing protein Os01g0234100-like isoform X1 [Erythranthe guttata]
MDLTNQKKKNGDSVSTDRPYKRSFGLRSSAMNRAQTIQANLSPHFPSFAKPMQISHVARKFELTLPKLFCDAHLPKKDGMIVFLDENDQSYNINYVVRVRDRFDLTGGWRSFSTAHALLEGDVLVFQLIEPCKFKVYIVKDTRLTKVDGPNRDRFHRKPIKAGTCMVPHLLVLFSLFAQEIDDFLQFRHYCLAKTEPEEENSDPIERTRNKYLERISQKTKTDRTTPIRKPARDEYASYSDSFGTERSLEYSLLGFKDFKDFSIYIDGLTIDSEIPTDCKEKYYGLCKSRNMFLHENLVQGLNGKLAVEMISETIRIADAIRAVDSKTAPGLMEGWDKTLKGFEEIGMVVGFLRVRIRKLIRVFREYRAGIELKRIERDEAEEERIALNVKLWRVENWIGEIDAEIDALSAKNESMGPVLKEIACAPW